MEDLKQAVASIEESMDIGHEGMDIDEVRIGDNREAVIEDLLHWSYAKCLKPMIARVAKKYCFGCEHECPSQRDHDACIMMTYVEQVITHFDEAKELLDENLVMGMFFAELTKMHPFVRYHEVTDLVNPGFRQCKWKDWYDSVMDKLLALEFYPC